MTQAESVMIDLLRASLTGSPFENRNPAVDWNAVRECAELQTVAGLIAKQVPLEAGTQWQEIARQHLAYFSLENGIGGAVLMGGQPYGGDNAQSGEFGHMCVEPGGLECSCGKNGCMEAYCSPLRIEKTFGVSLEEFFRGAEMHDPEYEALLYDMLRHLALSINNVHMVLDCDVILGGLLSEYLQPWMPILKEYIIAGNPFTDDADFVKLSTLRHHITPLGAALYFVQKFVNSV